MPKENLIDRVLEEFDEKYDTGDIVQQFEDMYGNVEFYNVKDEIKNFIKQTLKKEIQKIAEDVIGEWILTEQDEEDKYDLSGKEMPQWKEDFKMGYDKKNYELTAYFQTIGVRIK